MRNGGKFKIEEWKAIKIPATRTASTKLRDRLVKLSLKELQDEIIAKDISLILSKHEDCVSAIINFYIVNDLLVDQDSPLSTTPKNQHFTLSPIDSSIKELNSELQSFDSRHNNASSLEGHTQQSQAATVEELTTSFQSSVLDQFRLQQEQITQQQQRFDSLQSVMSHILSALNDNKQMRFLPIAMPQQQTLPNNQGPFTNITSFVEPERSQQVTVPELSAIASAQAIKLLSATISNFNESDTEDTDQIRRSG